MDDQELFHHEVQPWTVGQLRAALAGLPDHLPLDVNVADRPGGGMVHTQVVTGAGFCTVVNGDGSEDIVRTFSIECDFESGDYYRDRR